MGAQRLHEALHAGETAGHNRIARLMAKDGLASVPQRRRWRRKPSGTRPFHVRNHLARDFAANEPNTKWVVDITYIRIGEGWLYPCSAGSRCANAWTAATNPCATPVRESWMTSSMPLALWIASSS